MIRPEETATDTRNIQLTRRGIQCPEQDRLQLGTACSCDFQSNAGRFSAAQQGDQYG